MALITLKEKGSGVSRPKERFEEARGEVAEEQVVASVKNGAGLE